MVSEKRPLQGGNICIGGKRKVQFAGAGGEGPGEREKEAEKRRNTRREKNMSRRMATGKYSRWKSWVTVNALEQTHHWWGKWVRGNEGGCKARKGFLQPEPTFSFSQPLRVNGSFKALKVTLSFKG